MLLVRLVRAIRIAGVLAVAIGRRGRRIRVATGGARPVGVAAALDVAGGVIPAATVVGPADAGVGHQVADRHRRRRVVDGRDLVGEAGRGRLIPGQDRVHREVTAGEIGHGRRQAARLERVAVQRRRRARIERIWVRLAARHASAVQDRVRLAEGDGRVGHRAVVRVGVERCRGRDEVLVVQERAAERGLEEVVRDDVVGRALLVQVADTTGASSCRSSPSTCRPSRCR